MAEYREFRYWAYDFTGEGFSHGDGLNAPVIGNWPLTPGETVDVFLRALVFLGTDGNDGGLFEDPSDGSVVYVSDTNQLNPDDPLPEPISQELNLDGSPGKMVDDDGGDGTGEILGTSFDDEISRDGVSDGVTGGVPSNTSDIIKGFGGNDTIDGAGGGDMIDGGAGNDSLKGGAGNDTILGKGGNDTLDGDSGSDTLKGGDGADRLTGGDGKDTLIGGKQNDVLKGGAKDDELSGGSGKDKLTGGDGNDDLTGGSGNDTFIFKSIGETDGVGDNITDFGNGDDVMDLSQFDAKTGVDGNQAFKFIGTDKFSDSAGELRYAVDKVTGDVEVKGDVDGDGDKDFSIRLEDISSLTADDFIL